MDPRRSGRPGKASKAPLAPGARRLGAAASDSESLPSAPSPQCPDMSPARDSKRRKSSSPESRRVVVAEPRAAVLRQRGEERPRLTPANALVLRGRAEVEGRKKAPEDAEPRRNDKLKGDKAGKAKKAEKAKRSKEEQAPRKKQKAEQKVKQTGGSKHAEEVQDEKGDDGKKKKKKEKKEKKHKEKQRKDEQKEEEPQKPPEEPEEPSDTEVQPPSPPKPKSQNVKSKKEKEKAEKNRNKSEKEKKKATSKHREQKVEEKKDKPSKKEVPTRRKEKKYQQREAERSKSDQPRQTADEPEAEARGAKASGRRERQMEAEAQSGSEISEIRDRRRRREPRSESRSRHRRRRQRIFPPDAWQVWPAGSYHPWSSQLAGAPFGVWPMQSVPSDMSQAWLRNMQQPQVAAPESDSSEESEDLEGRELEAPKAQEQQEEEQEQSEEEEEEEEPELDQPSGPSGPSILKSSVPIVPILKTTVPPQPGILKTAPGVLKTTLPAQIAVPDDDDGSATTRTSEGEESETESQDEDAEIGEAPVARRPIIELGKGVEDISMPKVKWFPPGPERPRAALHHSMQRWCGPKVGWMALYQLDIDPAVQMKSSVQQIREGDGKGVVDPDASEIEATSEANPSEAPVREEGPVVPLLIPRWGSTRGWASPSEVAVEDSLRWEKRKLSSNVLRSRRAGRSSAGGGGGANPQDPPEADPAQDGKPGTSTFLIFLGTAARSVRILVEWRPPPQLVLPEDVIVDPTKYRGVERNLRQKRRPKAAAKPAAAKKKAAVKSSPGTPPPKVQPEPNTSNSDYQAKLRALMQQLQDGSATADAVSSFWNSLSPANRVLFSSEFPQFMHLVQPDRAVQSKAAMPVQQAHLLPPTSVMHLPVPPPPKTPPGLISVAPMAPGLAAVAPVAWAKAQLTPEVIKQQEAAWANRLTFHDGILRADMSSLQLGDTGLARWCKWAPSLLKTLGSAGGAPLSNADLNFSGNALEDAGLRQLLDLLRSCDVHVRCLNLDANRLTEASLVAISDFIAELRLAVSAVHMKNNRVQGSYGIMHLARAIKSNDKYPMSEKKRYTPLMLHLAGNMIDRPMQVTQLLKEALDNKFPSLSEDRQYWESKQQCPPLQLPCFDKQETSLFQ